MSMKWVADVLRAKGINIVRQSFGPHPEIDCIPACGCLVNIRAAFEGAEAVRQIEQHTANCKGKNK